MHVGAREMVLMNPFAGQEQRHRHPEQTCGHRGGRRGWAELRELHGHIYSTMCKTDSRIAQSSAWSSVLSLRGRVGWWEGGSRRGGYLYTYS